MRSRAILARLMVASVIGAAGLEGQTRVTTTVTATSISPVLWSPMTTMPAPISLGATDRIVIKELHGLFGFGRVNNVLHRWNLTEYCFAPMVASCAAGQHKSPNGSCCSWSVGVKAPYRPNVEVRALVDLAGNNPSQIFLLEEIGTLTAPPPGTGSMKTTLEPGQSLALINGRTLTILKYGWGATDYMLKVGEQILERWTTAGTVILSDQSQRVALLRNIGQHRVDNWGVPKSALSKMQ